MPKEKKRSDFLITISHPYKLFRTFVLLFVLIFTGYFFVTYEPTTHSVWFDDIHGPVAITGSEQGELIREVVSGLYESRFHPARLPSVQNGDSPRIVFLSVSNGEMSSRVVVGKGNTFREAVEHALLESRKPATRVERPKWFRIDIVQDVYSQSGTTLNTPLKLDPSQYGIAFGRKEQLAFLPEETLANHLVSPTQTLLPQEIEEHISTDPAALERFRTLKNAKSFKVFWFTTLSLFSDGKKYVELKRGQRQYEKLTEMSVLESAALAGDYLSQALNSEGRFAYTFNPTTGTISSDYDFYQHAGAIYSMLELYEALKNTALIQVADYGLSYLMEHTKPCGKSALCVVNNNEVTLGANALSAIALAKYMKVAQTTKYKDQVLQLGRWILQSQTESGNFGIHKRSFPEGKTLVHVHGEYPGAAALALLRIYELDKKDHWLAAAEKAIHYLITERDLRTPDAKLIADYWQLMALNELYRRRKKPFYLRHAQRIAAAIASRQNRGLIFPQWIGSFHRPPRSTETAKNTRGLCAAYQLVRDYGTKRVAEKLIETLELAVAFEMKTQFMPESVLYVSRPERTVGGFRRTPTDYEISIENVQHNLSSLLCYREVLSRQ